MTILLTCEKRKADSSRIQSEDQTVRTSMFESAPPSTRSYWLILSALPPWLEDNLLKQEVSTLMREAVMDLLINFTQRKERIREENGNKTLEKNNLDGRQRYFLDGICNKSGHNCIDLTAPLNGEINEWNMDHQVQCILWGLINLLVPRRKTTWSGCYVAPESIIFLAGQVSASDWVVFVRVHKADNNQHLVEKVVFHLHDSYS